MKSICNDSWLLITKYCDFVTLSMLSDTNKQFIEMAKENFKTREWLSEDLEELVTKDRFSLAKKAVKENWLDDVELDDACHQAIINENIKLMEIIAQNTATTRLMRSFDLIAKSDLKKNLKFIWILLKYKRTDIVSINQMFVYGCLVGDVKLVNLLMKDPSVDIRCEQDKPIIIAIRKKHNEIVKILLDTGKIDNANQQNILYEAMSNSEAFKMLMEYKPFDINFTLNFGLNNASNEIINMIVSDEILDPSFDNSKPVVLAAGFKNPELLERLLKDERVDLSVRGNEALNRACESGNIKCVELLLNHKQIDPSAGNNHCIKIAHGYSAFFGHRGHKIVKLLMKHSKVNPFNRKLKSIEELKNTDYGVYFGSLLLPPLPTE